MDPQVHPDSVNFRHKDYFIWTLQFGNIHWSHPLYAASEQTRKQLSDIHILKTPSESTGRRAHTVWGTFLTAEVWELFLCGPCEIGIE